MRPSVEICASASSKIRRLISAYCGALRRTIHALSVQDQAEVKPSGKQNAKFDATIAIATARIGTRVEYKLFDRDLDPTSCKIVAAVSPGSDRGAATVGERSERVIAADRRHRLH